VTQGDPAGAALQRAAELLDAAMGGGYLGACVVSVAGVGLATEQAHPFAVSTSIPGVRDAVVGYGDTLPQAAANYEWAVRTALLELAKRVTAALKAHEATR
jgi:hypothetical protein